MLDPKDLIKEKLDIVEVIREFLALKPAGSNWKGLCPFHKEKTPSFMVSPDRQSWHCFGCNKGGDVFSFVMEKEGMEFPEALRMFAEKTGIELKRGDVKLQNQKTVLYDIMETTVAWWHEWLVADEGKQARAYLAQREISDDTIMGWQIGLAPESWDRLSQYLTTKGFKLADIIASGVVIERDRASGDRRLPFYDRFRGRIMIPIRNHQGMVVGATGRVMPGGEENPPAGGAKYVNTPETPVYNKGRILFALDRAKQAIKDAGVAVLVEGNMDAIASHAAGVANVVAVSGTALTAEHTRLLRRYTDTVALCFDEDAAGQTASRRGIDLLLQEGFAIEIVRLPDGVKDPDECIQKDARLWQDAVQHRTLFFDALFARAATRDLSNIKEKKAIAKDLLSLLAKVPDAVERGHYIKKLAGLLQVEEQFLYEALPSQKRVVRVSPEESPRTNSRHITLSERLLALALHAPEHLHLIFTEVEPPMVAPGPLRDLYTDLRSLYNQQQSSDAVHALAKERKEIFDRLSLAAEHFFSSFDRVEIAKEVRTSITELKRYTIREELSRITEEVRTLSDDAKSAVLLARANTLTQILSSL